MRPRLAIVAFAAEQAWSPRGERALAVAEAAGAIAQVELIAPAGHRRLRQRARGLTRAISPLLLDRWEPEAVANVSRRMRRRRLDGGLLVGFPFSSVYWGARWLAGRGVPYVVDLGDPWALTLPPGERPPMGGLRAARCEAFVWRHAAAAVVTTRQQADALLGHLGAVPVVVRPNGYHPIGAAAPAGHHRGPGDHGGPAGHRRGPGDRTLRMVHYGNLYSARLDVVPLLAGLARSGRWDRVVLTQQGEDWSGSLARLPPGVHVEWSPLRSWEEVVATARKHDLAVVVGNRNPAQLPSKAVQYLTLPIPRLAVVTGRRDEALAEYVSDKPGWLTVAADAPAGAAAAAVAAHTAHAWTEQDLRAPDRESWEAVAGELVEVLLRHTLGIPRSSRSAPAAPRPLAAGSRRAG